MTIELILALAGFAFVTSITPGPNNIMLMTSGANFGFRRTIPHMLGVGIGFCLMIVLVGFGLAAINQPASGAWTVLVQQMRRVPTSPARLRACNISMAVLLIASLVPML